MTKRNSKRISGIGVGEGSPDTSSSGSNEESLRPKPESTSVTHLSSNKRCKRSPVDSEDAFLSRGRPFKKCKLCSRDLSIDGELDVDMGNIKQAHEMSSSGSGQNSGEETRDKKEPLGEEDTSSDPCGEFQMLDNASVLSDRINPFDTVPESEYNKQLKKDLDETSQSTNSSDLVRYQNNSKRFKQISDVCGQCIQRPGNPKRTASRTAMVQSGDCVTRTDELSGLQQEAQRALDKLNHGPSRGAVSDGSSSSLDVSCESEEQTYSYELLSALSKDISKQVTGVLKWLPSFNMNSLFRYQAPHDYVVADMMATVSLKFMTRDLTTQVEKLTKNLKKLKQRCADGSDTECGLSSPKSESDDSDGETRDKMQKVLSMMPANLLEFVENADDDTRSVILALLILTPDDLERIPEERRELVLQARNNVLSQFA